MIEIFGEEYYIDLEELDTFLIMDPDLTKDVTVKIIESFDAKSKLAGKDVVTDEHIRHKEVNGVKYELMRNFIADLGDGAEDSGDYDSKLSSRNLEKMSVRFKLAFNTLIYYDILKKLD